MKRVVEGVFLWEVFFLIIGIVLLYDLIALRKQNNQIIESLEKIERKLGKILVKKREII